MRSSRWLAGLAALCLAAGSGAAAGPGETRRSSARVDRAFLGDTLRVLMIAETQGNLEPCACPENPLGGLARRVGTLAAAPEALRLSGGGLLPQGEVPLRNDPVVRQRLVALLLDAAYRSGFDLLAMDHAERAFCYLTAATETRRLESRLFDADPPAPARFFRWQDRIVAVLALEETLSDEALRTASAAARGAGVRLATDGERPLLFVLGRADSSSGRRLARLTEADLVFLSRGARTETPLREGKSILVGSGTQGRWISELRLGFAAESRRLVVGSYQLLPMDARAKEDPAVKTEVTKLVTQSGVALSSVLTSSE